MKKTTPHWIAIDLLSTVLVAIGFKFIVLARCLIEKGNRRVRYVVSHLM